MLRSALAALLALTVSAPALAAPLPIKVQRLDNGLKVLLLERHQAPVVTFQVWYRVGSRNENIGQTGISHFLEHLMFQGSKNYPGNLYDRLVEGNGGSNNAFTTNDLTCFYVDFPSNLLDLAAKLEADRMHNLLIPPQTFQSELSVVKEERRLRENSPFGQMYEELCALSFKNHPYRWPVVGWMNDLDHMSREKVQNYYKTYYAPNNATVVVVGDFKTPEALAIIKRHFAKIPRTPEIPKLVVQEEPQVAERRAYLHRDLASPYLLMGYHAPAALTKDSYAISILNLILGEGASSRLNQDLVEKRQIAQEISSGLQSRLDSGFYTMAAVAMPGHSITEVESAIDAHIERLKTEPVTDRELQKAINSAEAGYIFGQESCHGLAQSIGEMDVQGDYKAIDTYVQKFREVTKEDIMRVAKQYLNVTNRTVVTMTGEKQ